VFDFEAVVSLLLPTRLAVTSLSARGLALLDRMASVLQRDMSDQSRRQIVKKKAPAKKENRGVRTLSAKTLTAKQARGVKGGSLKFCATGKHIAKVNLFVR
jgi:hypothetical protein